MKHALLREPLLHFFLLGGVLFFIFKVADTKISEPPAKIVVSASRVANLGEQFSRTWRRAPTDEEMQELVEGYVRDEVFYREGRAAGLDLDDPVIRRRVRQKMEFLSDDGAVEEPSDEQLASYLSANQAAFKTDGRLSFQHVFLSSTKRGSALDADARRIAQTISLTTAPLDTVSLGDPFLLGEDFREVSESDVARTFGDRFVNQLAIADTGRWQGPIQSSFGAHFVRIDQRTEGNLPPLDSVREAVRREWLNARRVEAERKLYQTMRSRYAIEVEKAPKGPSSETRQ